MYINKMSSWGCLGDILYCPTPVNQALCKHMRCQTSTSSTPSMAGAVRQCYCLMTTCATLYSKCNQCLHIQQPQQWRCCSENMRNAHNSAHLYTLTGHSIVNTSNTKKQLRLRPTMSLTPCTQNHTHIKVKHILNIIYIHQGVNITLSQLPIKAIDTFKSNFRLLVYY